MSGKVFISHAQEDEQRCAPLLRALDAWGVDYWYDRHEQGAGTPLSEKAQIELVEATVFLRLCTRNTRRSYWMSIESGAFLGLQADDHRAGKAGQRTLVNLILDAAYVREPFDRATTVLDASDSSQPGWVNALRAVLGLPPLDGMEAIDTVARAVSPSPAPARISRRRAIGLGVAGAAVLAAAGGGAVLLSRGSAGHPSVAATPTSTPPTHDPHVLWFYDARDPNNATPVNIAGWPATDGSTIYVGPSDGSIHALDGRTGKYIWKHAGITGGATLRGPTVAPGFVYACADGEGVYALAAASGAQQWQYKTECSQTSVVVQEDDLLYVTNVGGLVPDTFVKVLDAHSGAYRHSIGALSGLTFTGAIPVIVAGVLYAGDSSGYAYAFDATRDAEPIWRADVGSAGAKNNNFVFSAVGVADGTAYFNSGDGAIYAFDTRNGARRWRQPVKSEYASTPAVSDGMVFVGAADNKVYALDAATGTVRWSYVTGGAVRSSPVVADGVVYVGSDDTNVSAIDAKSGKGIHTYKTGGAIVSRPLILNGAIVVTALDGFVYAFTRS